jgi:hypothetical protein
MESKRFRKPAPSEQAILNGVEVILLGEDEAQLARYDGLMEAHHYLKNSQLVGERLRYVAVFDGQWLALLSWSAAAYHLKDRDAWVGWSVTQRRRRLALVANNSRFAILPGVDCPNLATRVLALNLARLSTDWERAYGHPILAVESFVDSQWFRGTCYRAQGWTLLGTTQGFGRHAEDYYTAHERPKQLWVRELGPDARASLRAAALPPALQPVEDKVLPRAAVPIKAVHALVARCRVVPDWRGTKGRDYPLAGLLAMIVLATLCGVVRGQRDLAAFASGLSQAQLRALLCRKGRNGRYQSRRRPPFFGSSPPSMPRCTDGFCASGPRPAWGRVPTLWSRLTARPSAAARRTVPTSKRRNWSARSVSRAAGRWAARSWRPRATKSPPRAPCSKASGRWTGKSSRSTPCIPTRKPCARSRRTTGPISCSR